MASKIATKRVGAELKGIRGPDEQPAKITHSRVATGFPDAHASLDAVFDFFNNEHGRLAVRVSRRTGNKVNRTAVWEFTAVENRDSKGLAGFTDFAASLGIKGAQLANLIAGFKPSGS